MSLASRGITGARVACAVWASAILTGLAILTAYENAPGDQGEPPALWPEATSLHRTQGVMTLLMVAHPICPCTRASLGELARIVARAGGRLHAYVLFVSPEGADSTWSRGDLWNEAAAIPGVSVVEDHDGMEADRFGVAVSGHVLLYDARGRLSFSGGITPARGHSGDSTGRAAVLALLEGRSPSHSRSFVFGCSLLGAADRAHGGRAHCNHS